MLTKENMLLEIRGLWRDTIRYADGREEVGEWKHNQMQDTAATLVAGLLLRYAFRVVPPVDGWDGITYMGIGSGLVGWDAVPPVQDPGDTTLTTEFYRKAITPEDMTFLDEITGAPSLTPTNRILITCSFGPGIAGMPPNGSWREFGLFGGGASGTLDSGTLYNWVVHPLIIKDTHLSITREVDLLIRKPHEACP